MNPDKIPERYSSHQKQHSSTKKEKKEKKEEKKKSNTRYDDYLNPQAGKLTSIH